MKIGNLIVEPGVMNAACSVAKSPEDVAALAATNIGAIIVGSITVAQRDGNPEPRWYVGDDFALNSFGMPNGGLEYYQKELPGMIDVAHEAGKKLILSIAGFNEDEYGQLAELADSVKVDAIEINLGCPNISVDGHQKPIASFDTDYMTHIITLVSEKSKLPLLVKLSPYSNPAELKKVADLLAKLGVVSAVVASNTFPNGYISEHGKPVIAQTLAGVSGKALHAIALGQVYQFRQNLPESIAVIGAGGIENKDDTKAFYEAGASAVQVATVIVRDGHVAINKVVA